MTIGIPGGVAQYDPQVKTYRAVVGDLVIGNYQDEIKTVEEFQALLAGLGVVLTDQDILDLQNEKVQE